MTADLILHGGLIRTMNPRRPVVDAVGVRDGRIAALGKDEVRALGSAGADVVDLGGRTVVPGFHDAHVHPLTGGLARLRCDLSDVHGMDAYDGVLREHAAANPAGEWIQGGGWYGDAFPGGFPTKELLDTYFPDRPVVLSSHDLHSVVVNTSALSRLGIDRDTPDPTGGRIHRDAEGRPTGVLMEAATRLVTEHLPDVTAADVKRALLEAQAYLHGLGITAWQDALVGAYSTVPDSFPGYLTLADEGLLTGKVTAALFVDPLREVPGQLEEFRRKRDLARQREGATLQATAVKIIQDGVCENFTGALLEPYRGRPQDRGDATFEPERLREIVRLFHDDGFDIHIHAVGDRAVRDTLGAFGSVSLTDPDRRHQIAHIDLIHPDDVAPFAASGIIANVQPLWARRDPVLVETKLPHLTEEQQQRHFVFRTLRDAGIPMAFSSDWPVSSPDPLWGMHVAVNRTAPFADPHAQDEESRKAPLLPGEAVTVEDALAAYTQGGARANRLEHLSGSLDVGLAADLVVLDRDPLAVDRREVGDIRAEMTFVDGVAVHGG